MKWIAAVLCASLASAAVYLLFLVTFASLHFEGGWASGISIGMAMGTAGGTYHMIANKPRKRA